VLCVCRLSPCGGIYRSEWDLHRLGEVGLVLGGGRPAEWNGLHRLSPLTQASPPCVDMWQPSFGSNRLKPWPTDQGVGPTGQPLGPLGLGPGPTWSMCEIHPRVDDNFDIWSTSPCHPLKCSNFVPTFLKSNKHYNRETRLVDKVNTWLFHTFTQHVGT
jgi:hypothetical protein